MTIHPVRLLRHNSILLRRKNKRLLAVVPERAASERLPACYYLHGWGGTAEAYLNYEPILGILGRIEQVSIFAESFRNWFINDYQGNRYEDYLIQEALPAAEAEWLPHGCTCRMVAGFSMGGLSALSLAWRHPPLFDGVASFAGALEAPSRIGDPYAQFRDHPDFLMPTESDHTRTWGSSGSAVRREYDPYDPLAVAALRGKPIYLAAGTRDFERILKMNRRFHAYLVKAEVPHKYEEYPNGHDMGIVASSLPSALDYLQKSRVETR